MEHVSEAGAPSRALLLTEPARAAAELASMVIGQPLLHRAPRGDGHTVLVLPGFLADDRTTLVLRTYLNRLGYNAKGWGLGRNLGPTAEILEGMEDRLAALAQSSGMAVSLIGWSMGGMFARGLARDHADSIRQIITLGSPFRSDVPIGSHATRSFERLAHLHVPHTELPPAETDRSPLDVPVTAVFSKGDGIVAWQSCVQDDGPERESVEVIGSHCGLGHNAAALWVIADRLAQPLGIWAPFVRPAHAHLVFPEHAEARLAA